MRKTIFAFVVALALAAFPAMTQDILISGLNYNEIRYVSDYVYDDSGAAALETPALLIKYVGTLESGTLDVNGNAIEFHSGALGAEDNAPSDESDVNTGDVCAATDNALDITDAQCDTPAELCAVVNASGAPWVCVQQGVLGTDTLGTAGDYIDMADAQAKVPGGFPVILDSSASDTMAVLIRPDIGLDPNRATIPRGDIEFFLSGQSSTTAFLQTLRQNPFAGTRTILRDFTAYVDSTGVWTLSVYGVKYDSGDPDGVPTQRLIWTTDATADVTEEVVTQDIYSAPGEALMIFVLDDALVNAWIQYTAAVIPAR